MLKLCNFAVIKVSQILFPMKTWTEKLNKFIKFCIKIPNRFWEIGKKIRGALFSAALCIFTRVCQRAVQVIHLNFTAMICQATSTLLPVILKLTLLVTFLMCQSYSTHSEVYTDKMSDTTTDTKHIVWVRMGYTICGLLAFILWIFFIFTYSFQYLNIPVCPPIFCGLRNPSRTSKIC